MNLSWNLNLIRSLEFGNVDVDLNIGINALPKDLLELIFGKLPPSEDRSTTLVCRKWNQIISTLPDPTLRIFGSEAWQNFFGFEFQGEIPLLPKDIRQHARRLRNRLAGKEYGPPFTAVLMHKGLSLNDLRHYMEKQAEGIKQTIVVLETLSNQPIKESYWFIMTDHEIEGSKNKNYADQKLLVERKSKSECQLPTSLEAIAFCVLHFVSTGKYLFGKDPYTYVRCQDQVNGHSLAVGGGLSIITHTINEHTSAAACKRFP